MTTDRKIFIFSARRGIMAEIEYPGIAKLVSRLVWENTTSRIKNSITGCSAVGSAPALGVPWRYPEQGKAKRCKALWHLRLWDFHRLPKTAQKRL